MRKTITTFVIMAAVAAGALGFYRVSSRPRTPDEVVLRSYEYLRRGNMSRLETCYTEAAWAHMRTALPAKGDRDALGNLKRYMDRLGDVTVTSSVVTGTIADVEALIHYDGKAEHERFRLVLDAGLWRID